MGSCFLLACWLYIPLHYRYQVNKLFIHSLPSMNKFSGSWKCGWPCTATSFESIPMACFFWNFHGSSYSRKVCPGILWYCWIRTSGIEKFKHFLTLPMSSSSSTCASIWSPGIFLTQLISIVQVTRDTSICQETLLPWSHWSPQSEWLAGMFTPWWRRRKRNDTMNNSSIKSSHIIFPFFIFSFTRRIFWTVLHRSHARFCLKHFQFGLWCRHG